MINLLCRKCGHDLEVVDVDYCGNGWKRFYVYCFDCDREYSLLKRCKE